MRSSGCARGDRGTVTAELAVALPVLVLIVAAAVSAVGVSGARVRTQDAAREAARAAARGDLAAARTLAARAAPGVQLTIGRDGAAIVAVARLSVHPVADWLPAVIVTERAVAAVEPTAP